MSRNIRSWLTWYTLLGVLLTTSASDTFAEDAAALQAAAAQAAALQKATARNPEKHKGDFVANNDRVWNNLEALCGTVTPACANAAVFAAAAQCENSANYFRKGTKGWQIFSIVLTLASAGFTGAGASTTLSQAKVLSTLGGSTGLAAILPTLNANAAGDQTGLATVAATIAKLQAYALPTGTTPTRPADADLYTQARLFGAACATAANASPAQNSSAPPPSKPASN